MRVRAFTQDDAHVYCTLEQVTDEVDSICQAIDALYARFGFDEVRVELSTRPDKYIGTGEQWDAAEGALREALERQGREHEVSPGEGTFYGPKIDFHITDALGRSWQCGTCQLDFQMPERFDLSYQGADNEEHRPVMIHRAADRHNDYAAQVARRLAESGVRHRIDDRSESVGKKIHDAEVSKAPYMLVVGDREAAGAAVAVRSHAEGDLGSESV